MITHIKQALEVIAGRPEFVVADKGGYHVIDYVYQDADTFADPLRTELRGIKFATDGSVLARPFHKFFNVGERADTQLHRIAWHEPHFVYEKLDGSMIHTAVVDGRVRLMTRMGITETAIRCERDWLARVRASFDGGYIHSGETPIFEWVGPSNPHVVRYDDDQLVLLALRDTQSGGYHDHDTVQRIAQRCGFALPRIIASNLGIYASSFVQDVRSWEHGDEGVVVTFVDGPFYKIKSDAYVALHKVKDSLTHEKDVLALVLDGRIDDVLAIASSEDHARLTKYRDDISRRVTGLVDYVATVARSYVRAGERKTFAVVVAPKLPLAVRAAAFGMFDGRDPRETLLKVIRSACRSGPEVARMCDDLNLPRWSCDV